MIKKILGFCILCIGVVGIFLPLVPALVLIPLGLSMIGNTKVREWFIKTFTKKEGHQNETESAKKGDIDDRS